MTTVHTQYGPGEIVASDHVRGRRQYKVAGPGFEVWMDEAKIPLHTAAPVSEPPSTRRRHEITRQGWAPVDFEHSTDLPYNPDPQYPAIPGDIESTIQPIHEIDPDERLHPSDSITFDRREHSEADRRGEPGPNPDLFAKGASRYYYADYEDEGEFHPADADEDAYNGPPPQGPGPEDDPESLLQRAPGWQDKTLGELVAEVEQLVQIHPDWVDRPMGELVDIEEGGDQGIPPDQGGLPPELGDQGPPEEGGEEEELPDEGPSDENPFDEGDEDEGESPEEDEESEDEGPPEDSDEGESDEGGEDEDESDEDHDEDEDHDDEEVPEECEEYVKEGGRRKAQWQALIPLLEGAGEGGAAAGEAGAAEGGAGGGIPGAGGGMPGAGGIPVPQIDPNNPLPLPDLGHGWGDLAALKGASYRPAGLSDKYIDLQAAADHYHDPVTLFRDDPVSYINRIGHVHDEGLNPRFAQYGLLVESDRQIREAAWKDVRQKAMRLRREGHITIHHVTPQHIYATVKGDTGTYDTMIVKGNTGAFTNGQSVANWHCDCEWGKWAFKRKYSFVGRLCSHAYACYLDMQSAHLKGQKRQPYRPAPKRRKKADALQMIPTRLVPELVVNDSQDTDEFRTDVTKDERKTTGPGQIVHFSKLMAHCDRHKLAYPRELVAFLLTAAGGGTQRNKLPADNSDPSGTWVVDQQGGRTRGQPHFQPNTPQGGTGGSPPVNTQGATGPAPGPSPNNPTPIGQVTPGGGGVFYPGDPHAGGGPNQMSPTQPVGGPPPAAQPAPGGGTAGGGAGATFNPATGGGFGAGGAWTPSTDKTTIAPSVSSYTVAPGDTLSGIAGRAGVDVGQLKAPSGDPNMIHPGETIDIPGGHPGNTPSAMDTTFKNLTEQADKLPGKPDTSGAAAMDTTFKNLTEQADKLPGKPDIGGANPAAPPAVPPPAAPAAPPPPAAPAKLPTTSSRRRLAAPYRLAAGDVIVRRADKSVGPAPDADDDSSAPAPAASKPAPRPGAQDVHATQPGAVAPPAAAAAPGKKKAPGATLADTTPSAGTDPNNPQSSQQQQQPAKQQQPGLAGMGAGMGDMSGLMSGLGNAAGGIGSALAPAIGEIGQAVAPAIGNAVSGLGGELAHGLGGLGGGLASGLGGALSGLTHIFGQRVAAGYPTVEGLAHEPFEGLGAAGPLEIHDSKSNVEDNYSDHRQDVTDLGRYELHGGDGLDEYRIASMFFTADDIGGGTGTTSGGDQGGLGGAAGISSGTGMGDPTVGTATTTPPGMTSPGTTDFGGGQRDPGMPGGANPGATGGLGLTPTASYHYAEDQTPEDWEVNSPSEAGPELRQLREWAADGQEDYFGDMADHVDDVQEAVEEAHEHGVAASPLVAHRHYADALEQPIVAAGPPIDMQPAPGGVPAQPITGGIKRAGKAPKRAPVVPEVVRVYGGGGQPVHQGSAVADIPDPYSKTAADFNDYDEPSMQLTAGEDPVAAFQRSAAAANLMSANSGGGGGEEFDISGAASSFLQRTAGRNYSLAEQHELMNERHPLGARNLDSLDLAGTHYEAENSVGLW